jgi:hypothetical protein
VTVLGEDLVTDPVQPYRWVLVFGHLVFYPLPHPWNRPASGSQSRRHLVLANDIVSQGDWRKVPVMLTSSLMANLLLLAVGLQR